MPRSASSPTAVRRIVIVVGLAASAFAAAQPFEAVYGGATSSETAGRRVVPVRFCAGEGFITVGTSTPASGTSDAYLVRTDDHGFVLWERTYDIGRVGAADTGESVTELYSSLGFVVAGTTDVAIDKDIFLLKVGCDGAVQWTRTYGSVEGWDEVASDVVEARRGDPRYGTAAGDLLVAGTVTDPAVGSGDAVLFRTAVNGTLRWNRRYDAGGLAQTLYALTEAQPSGSTSAGDVVATGVHVGAGGPTGLALRVSGNSGLLANSTHCAASYSGAPSGLVLTSVTELQTPPRAGQLALSGFALAPPAATVMLTAANPCSALMSAGVVSVPGYGVQITYAGQVREALETSAGVMAGDLALVGTMAGVAPPPGTGTYSYLQILEPIGLTPVPGALRIFGGPNGSALTMLAVLDDGFVLAGRNTADPQGVGDGADLYVVRTDAYGYTSCSSGWPPPSTDDWSEPEASTGRAFTRLYPTALAFLQSSTRSTSSVLDSDGFVFCE